MKIKIYKFPLLAIVALVTILSCSEDYLEVEPKGTFLTENYYSNQDEAFAGLVAAYDFLRKNSGGFWRIFKCKQSFCYRSRKGNSRWIQGRS